LDNVTDAVNYYKGKVIMIRISKKVLLACALFGLLLLAGCNGKQNDYDSDKSGFNIVTTLYPAYDFAREIAGDKVNITMLLKPGEESHSYDPTPQDIIRIKECDLFIYNGGENEEWVDGIVDSLGDVRVIRMMDCVDRLYEEEIAEGMYVRGDGHGHGHAHTYEHDMESEDDHAHEQEQGHEPEYGKEPEDDHAHEQEQGHEPEYDKEPEDDHAHEQEQGHEPEYDKEPEDDHAHTQEQVHDSEDADEVVTKEYDEHIWASPLNVVSIAQVITEELVKIDSGNEAYYEANCRQYTDELMEIDKSIRNIVANGKRKELIFGDRFPVRYFVEEYGLDYYAAFPGCSAEAEPSVATITFLIDKVKEDKVPIILKTELSNDNISKVIATETGTDVRTFYACHNISRQDYELGVTYIEQMKKNAEVLEEALN